MSEQKVIKNHLQIKPDGIIKSGSADYAATVSTGEIIYVTTVVAHFLFTDHGLQSQGSIRVDPSLFKSANLKVGQKYANGRVKIEIQKIEQHTATAHVNVDGVADGTVVISLEGEFIEVISIDAKGSFMGMTVHLVAV